jgi:hypothetical protein
MGWDVDRWRHSTLPEYFMAAAGYWRNWERNTAWLMREIVYEMILGNPNYKNSSKPNNSKEIYKIKDDEIKNDKEHKKPSPEELEEARRMLIGMRDRKK